jgi:P4 family phage/plasmid primase-like protien
VTELIYDSGTDEDKRLPQRVNGGGQTAAETAATQEVPADPQPKTPRWLKVGSDVEVASYVKTELTYDYGTVHYCEGEFWRFTGKQWEAIPQDSLRRIVHEYDGIAWGPHWKPLQLGAGRINSILNELAAMLSKPGFFDARLVGINCQNGFISFEEGEPRLLPHARKHRQRHVIPARWEPGSEAKIAAHSLLARLLRGSFESDEDADAKINLLAEIAGAAALGYGPRHTAPKAVVLLGRTAENGKSQVLDLLRGLLPPDAVSSVPPSRFGDDRHIVKLVGKLLNTSDELGTAEAIASDRFKAIVTGEPLTGRDVYRPAIDFRPQAQHVFACNQLPGFHGGMDRGVIRRLMPVVFNRTIPEEERIPNIGQRIVADELDLVLAWAVRGAARLLGRGHFPELASSREALQEWAQGADPVLGWLDDRVIPAALAVVGEGPPRVRSRDGYDDFKSWAVGEGYSPHGLPNINNFVQRVRAAGPSKGITYKHSGGFRGFVGMRLRPLGQSSARADVDAA